MDYCEALEEDQETPAGDSPHPLQSGEVLAGKVRYQMRVIGKMTILSSVLFGEMTVLTWMIPDLG